MSDSKKIIKVPFKGRLLEIRNPGIAEIVVLSLVALEDPRVDAILKAVDLKIKDAQGKLIFPEEYITVRGDDGDN